MKAKCLLLLFVLPLLLAGCDYRELGNSVFVSGMGVERTEEGKFCVSVETISSAKGSAEEYKPVVLHGEGTTVLEAITNMRGMIAQNLEFSHCTAILFSDELAREGIGAYVDDLYYYSDVDIDTLCIVTQDCKPFDVLSTEAKTYRSQAYELHATLVDVLGRKRTELVSLHMLFVNYHKSRSTILPTAHKVQIGEDEVIDLYGAAIMQGDRMLGTLTREEALPFLLTKNTVNYRILSVPVGDALFSARILQSEAKLDTKLEGEEAVVTVSIQATIDNLGALPEGVDIEQARASIAAYIGTSIADVLENTYQKLHCDLLNVDENLYLQYPKRHASPHEWRAYRPRYAVGCDVCLRLNHAIGE